MTIEGLWVAALLLAVVGLLIVAALNDIATMTIPNWISIAIAVAFVPAALISGMRIESIAVHLGCGVVLFVAGFFLFNVGALGGGDVKLLSAAAIWTGASALAPFLMSMMIAGGALAVTILVMRRCLTPSPALPAFLNRLVDRQRGIPYAVAIATAGALTWMQWPIASIL